MQSVHWQNVERWGKCVTKDIFPSGNLQIFLQIFTDPQIFLKMPYFTLSFPYRSRFVIVPMSKFKVEMADLSITF